MKKPIDPLIRIETLNTMLQSEQQLRQQAMNLASMANSMYNQVKIMECKLCLKQNNLSCKMFRKKHKMSIDKFGCRAFED